MHLLNKKYILKSNNLFLEDVKFNKLITGSSNEPQHLQNLQSSNEPQHLQNLQSSNEPPNMYHIHQNLQSSNEPPNPQSSNVSMRSLLGDTKFKCGFSDIIFDLFKYPTLFMRDIYKYMILFNHASFNDSMLIKKLKTHDVLDIEQIENNISKKKETYNKLSHNKLLYDVLRKLLSEIFNDQEDKILKVILTSSSF
jgi:hypothetical protein